MIPTVTVPNTDTTKEQAGRTHRILHLWLPLIVMLVTLEVIDIAFSLEVMPPALAAQWWSILEVAHLVCVVIGLVPPVMNWLGQRRQENDESDTTTW